MDAIKQAVLACVRDCGPHDELEADLGRIIAREGEAACRVVLEVLTHLNFETPAAVHHWQQILGHQAALREALQRPVPLAVAICDYFQWVKKYTGCAKLVDVQRFEEIFYRNQHDSLTGLHNREAFDEALTQELAHAKRHGRPFSLLFMDIDSFKEVNDTHGHLVGDRVLCAVGEMLLACKRAADLAARYGGDEFLLLLPDTDKQEALILAERIRARVAGQALVAGQPLRISLSCGAATFPDDGGDGQALKKYADDALYRSKRESWPGPTAPFPAELKMMERPGRPRTERPQPCLAMLCPAGRG